MTKFYIMWFIHWNDMSDWFGVKDMGECMYSIQHKKSSCHRDMWACVQPKSREDSGRTLGRNEQQGDYKGICIASWPSGKCAPYIKKCGNMTYQCKLLFDQISEASEKMVNPPLRDVGIWKFTVMLEMRMVYEYKLLLGEVIGGHPAYIRDYIGVQQLQLYPGTTVNHLDMHQNTARHHTTSWQDAIQAA